MTFCFSLIPERPTKYRTVDTRQGDLMQTWADSSARPTGAVIRVFLYRFGAGTPTLPPAANQKLTPSKKEGVNYVSHFVSFRPETIADEEYDGL